MNVYHLGKRFLTSLVARKLNDDEQQLVRSVLLDNELDLWMKSMKVDQRHSLVVLKRFLAIMPSAGRDAQASALLHDIGKSQLQMGIFSRVAATLIGPRTQRFSQYHRHEEIGIDLLEAARCSTITIGYLRGNGDPDVVDALATADNI